ncbi:MAG: hypothetical protein Q4E91_12520 [Lachnospiraceae bacterium]|nr:hypothetical protein [Lachnospiraceae bacterium]
MAHLQLNEINAWDAIFKELSHPEKMAKEAVNEAVQILESSTRQAVKASSNSDRLAQSFSRTPAKENDLGVYSVVRPAGDFNDDLTNEDLAAQFEHGRHGGYKRAGKKRAATAMEAKPWRQNAINAARAQCEATVERVVYEAVDKVTGG